MTSNLPTLPAGWEWKKLGEVSDFQGGSQPPKDEFSSVPLEGYVRLIQIRDYKSDDNIIYVKKESVRRFCNETDIMVGRYGPPVFQILRGLNGAYNVALMKAVFDEKIIDKDYLYFFLKNPNIQNYIIGLSQRAAGQSGVNKDALETYPFPLPPLDEQKRLVYLLDTLFAKIDRSIELLSENIAAADALLPSALNTVFGELGENLEMVTVEKALSNIQTGTTPSKQINKYYQEPQTIDWFSPSDFNEEKILMSSKNKLNQFASDEKKIKYYEENSLLLVAIGATVGKIGIIRQKATSNQQITALKFKNNILVDFAYYWFKHIKETIIGKASTATMPIINQSGIKSLPMIIPPLDIQTQSVAYLDSVRDKVETLKHVQNDKIAHLKALKASILDRAFKGEL